MSQPGSLPGNRHTIGRDLRWLFQCWLRFPPGRHDWHHFADCKICTRCGVLR